MSTGKLSGIPASCLVSEEIPQPITSCRRTFGEGTDWQEALVRRKEAYSPAKRREKRWQQNNCERDRTVGGKSFIRETLNLLTSADSITNTNKTNVISANLLDVLFDFEDIIMFGNISVLVTLQFW